MSYCLQVHDKGMHAGTGCTQVRTDTDNDDGSRVSFVVYNIPTSPGRSRMLVRQVRQPTPSRENDAWYGRRAHTNV